MQFALNLRYGIKTTILHHEIFLEEENRVTRCQILVNTIDGTGAAQKCVNGEMLC